MYKIERNSAYDFLGQNYAAVYPNIHKYPATMLPQIGIELLKEFKINKGVLLDPYCGSGSSFSAALETEIKEMHGFDLNPLAVKITSAKFTKIDVKKAENTRQELRNNIFEFIKLDSNLNMLDIPNFENIEFWFSNEVLKNLAVIRHFIQQIDCEKIKNLFLIPFAETCRDCSYTRNNEFKLYRIKSADVLSFNPDVFGVYFQKLNKVLDIYQRNYLPKLDKLNLSVCNTAFKTQSNFFDLVLTSPPYGDSKTTVAYGQFSTFPNEWLGVSKARQIDKILMGGERSKQIYNKGIIAKSIQSIAQQSIQRALEVSSFYEDLEQSIKQVADSVKIGGTCFYIVGNRRVKDVQLPTDQFIAEQFEQNGFTHQITYERLLTNKAMPTLNSPTNKAGVLKSTMNHEYIVICKK